jgi:hypothetical protein
MAEDYWACAEIRKKRVFSAQSYHHSGELINPTAHSSTLLHTPTHISIDASLFFTKVLILVKEKVTFFCGSGFYQACRFCVCTDTL